MINQLKSIGSFLFMQIYGQFQITINKTGRIGDSTNNSVQIFIEIHSGAFIIWSVFNIELALILNHGLVKYNGSIFSIIYMYAFI